MVKFIDKFLAILTVPWVENFNFDLISNNPISNFLENQCILGGCPGIPKKTCVYPHSCWPTDYAWGHLNYTLGGNLFRARPPAYVCHEPFYDEHACKVAKKHWTRCVGTFYIRPHFTVERITYDLRSEFWRAEQPGGYFDAGSYSSRVSKL
jgi:hypothetical protein